ncbi:hypothetical protein DRN86_03570 [Candidatus Geothermarchaeota archaeon]|nr:MAG: hypothetical protein DRN86_03570 [Candidatus Geothermarchaeota archaeon]
MIVLSKLLVIRMMSLKGKKGVSPVIATLLLILIAIAAGVAVYAYVTNWIGGATGATAVAQGELLLDYADAIDSDDDDNITAWVRNVGGVELVLTDAYVKYPNGTVKHNDNPAEITLPIGKVTKVVIGENKNISISLDLTKGDVYTVTLVCKDGTTLVFNVKAHD